jgi:hypothetical protein
MSVQKVLLPYNFTSYEGKALDFVIRVFGKREGHHITLFNAYTPPPSVDMQASPELVKMRGSIASLTNELRQKEEGLKSAMEYLVESGFSTDQVNYIFRQREKPIADEIIETVTKGHYRVLVLSRQPGKVTRMFSRSIHSKVLSTVTDITVCVAT